MAFPDYPIVNLDAPSERVVYERLTPAEWITRFPRAVIDEAQKLPAVFETIKACYDRDPGVRYLMLGSSQLLLLKQVRETLAGRVALLELFPLALPELAAPQGEAPAPSPLLQLLSAASPREELARQIDAVRCLSPRFARSAVAWESFLRWGGLPLLHGREGWNDDDRWAWLQDYQATYLQRDLADLARLDRLEPFVRAQRAAALRTAQPINFSELARLADISPPTAHQFMRYLEISYQVALIPGWYRNPEKRLSKQPKLHFLDPGVHRAVLAKRGAVNGAELESAVVAEVIKQARTARLALHFHHLRTADGREVDLLIEREDGYIALECKQAERVAPVDFRGLRALPSLLDKPLLLGLVVSQDRVNVGPLPADERLWSVPAPALLAGA